MQRFSCKYFTVFSFFTIFLMLFSVNTFGQLTRGSISGTVQDESGATVPGATVKVTAIGTNISRDVVTDDNGFYRIGALDPGKYTVKVEKDGFTSVENKELVVNTATDVIFDVSMKVGNVSETIDITADAEAVTLNKTNGTIGTTIESRRAVELPLGAGRNVNNLALLSPNVFAAPGSTGISANGQRARNNNFTIDGSDNNDISVTIPTIPIVAEAVNEFQIQTNPYSAENGRNTGAAINVGTKSGTNSFHGELWNYYRGSALNAMDNIEKRNPNLKSPAQFNRNQYGFSIGGPVFFPNIGDGGPSIYNGKDRTFFFFLYQGDKTTSGTLQGGTIRIPTPAGFAALNTVSLRTGQSVASRQAVLNQLSFLQGIYAQNPTFSNLSNICVNPTSAPTTNPPTCPGGTFIQTGQTNIGITQPVDAENYTVRFDHKITDNDNLTVRYIRNTSDQPNVTSNLNFGELFSAAQILSDQNLAISESHIFSSSLLNEFRFSYIGRDLDFPENDTKTPTTTIGGLVAFGGANNFPQSRISHFYQFSDTLSWNTGNHTMKFGADIRRNILSNFSGFDFKGTFTFANLQEYLNNNATAFTQAFSAADFDAKQWQQSYFVQDDWRVTSNLTLNFGLRYETASVPLGFFGTNDPVQNAALVPRPVKKDKNNFAPVFGFTYSPKFESGVMGAIFGDGLSSIRGGFRVAYDVLFYNLLTVNAANFPITTSVTRNNILDVYPTLAPPTTTPVFTPSASFVNSPENLKNPESYLYSLNIQREIARQFILEIGYSGSRSINQINQLQANPAQLTAAQIANVIGARDGGIVPNTTLYRCPVGQNLVPTPSDCAGALGTRRLYPALGQRTIIASEAQATYNSAYAFLRKRFSSGLLFDVAYTFSKLLSNNDESLGVAAITGGSSQVPQDFFNYSNEKSLSAFDRTHRLAVNYLYEIPTPGVIKRNGFANSILGGFQISGITQYQSGQPFTILTGVDSNGNGTAGSDRPNYNPNGIFLRDPVTGNLRTFTSPLVGGAFVVPLGLNGLPLANSLGNGNLGKNTLRAPGFWNTDLSVLKRFLLPWGGESRHQFLVRADFLNAFNQDNYGRPVNNMNSTDFGKNLNNWGNRSITLSGKYVF